MSGEEIVGEAACCRLQGRGSPSCCQTAALPGWLLCRQELGLHRRIDCWYLGTDIPT